MRVRVDAWRRQGHTQCAIVAQESFELDDVDGHAEPTAEWVPNQHRKSVLEAAQSCPEQAVNVISERVTRAPAAHGQRAES